MFTGYSSGGLGELFDEETEFRRRQQQTRRGDKRTGPQPTLHVCVICGDEFWTAHSTQKTCDEDCSAILKKQRIRERDRRVTVRRSMRSQNLQRKTGQ